MKKVYCFIVFIAFPLTILFRYFYLEKGIHSINESQKILLSSYSDVVIDSPVKHYLPASPTSNNQVDTSGSWFQQIAQHITASEYYIRYQDKVQAYQSPNKKNNFRAIYKPGEFSLVPRIDSLEKWRCKLLLETIRFNRNETYRPDTQACFQAKENTLNIIHRNLFTEQYINSPEGIRQNFIVHRAPEQTSDSLVINLKVEGDLFTEQKNDQSIHFYEKMSYGKEDRIRYSDLTCWDKNKKDLKAQMVLHNNVISLIVDTKEAVYPIIIDPISSTISTQLEINQASASLGRSVSSAGDVNGDGYSDVIVGAYKYDNGSSDEGAAFIFHGSSTGITTTIQTQLESNLAAAYFGISVNTAGDVNGDGYSDVIVGAYSFSNGHSDEGAAFVYHGSSSGVTTTIQAQLESNQVSAELGYSVSGAGDVNGDGYSDVIVGCDLYDNGQSDEGTAFVYHGSSSGINTTIQTRLEINQASAAFGYGVSAAGDVNADGYGDVFVAAIDYDNTQTNEGAVFVYHGSSSGVTTTIQRQIESNQNNAEMGHRIGFSGDINGDGYADLVAGAIYYDNGQTDEGAVFVYHGSSSGITSTLQVQIESNLAYAEFGRPAVSAGDVNGDGYGDIIVGAGYYANGSSDEGAAFVYHGSSTGLSSTIQTQIEINQASARMGYSVASAGDVNGDGYSDVIVGAPDYDNGSSNEGGAFLFHGSAQGGISTTYTTRLTKGQSGAHYGNSVACAGDVNADGYSDVMVSATTYDNGSTDEGAVFVYHGSSTGLSTTISTQIEGNQSWVYIGDCVSTAGDVNGDRYSDIIIGAVNYNNGGGTSAEGVAFVHHGSSSGISSTKTTQLESNQTSASFGCSVACAGDVNGDGYSDVIVGASSYDNGSSDEGAAFVYHGSSTGITTTIQTQLETNQANAYYGVSVAGAGDVNGDGFSDVIVGAYLYENGANTDEGNAFVYHGSSSGITTTIRTQLDPNYTGGYYGNCVNSAGDVNGDGYSDVIVSAMLIENGVDLGESTSFIYHGSSSGITTTVQTRIETNNTDPGGYAPTTYATSAGDLNGDGYGDIIVGSDVYGNGNDREGVTMIFYGSSSGVSTTTQTQIESGETDARLGLSVGCAGDVNGDGFSDVVIGSPYRDNSVSDEGVAYIFQGNKGLSGQRNNLKLYNTDLTTSISQSNFTATSFGIGLYGKSFIGKQKGKMYWEAKAQAVAFTGSPIANSVSSTSSQSSFTDLSTGTELTNTVTKQGFATKARARIKFDPVTAITGQVYSPWRYPANYLMGGSFMNATPLPVELLYFKEICRTDGTHLLWATQSESNNNFFTIEISHDGLNWKKVTIVKGAGNSNAQKQYEYVYSEIHSKGIYFQLSQTDYDGSSVKLSMVTSQCDEDMEDILVFPNPFSEAIKIEVQHKISNTLQLNILNVKGQYLMGFQWKGDDLDQNPVLMINTAFLNPGTYILQFNDGRNIQTKKLVKLE